MSEIIETPPTNIIDLRGLFRADVALNDMLKKVYSNPLPPPNEPTQKAPEETPQ